MSSLERRQLLPIQIMQYNVKDFSENETKEEKKKPRGGIVYLVSADRISILLESLNHLFVNFNDQFRYPIAIFHYGDIDDQNLLERINSALGYTRTELITVIVVQGMREFPQSFDSALVKQGKLNVVFQHIYPNYNFMCAFFFLKLYTQPWILQNNISYYMRLDSDSFILSKIDYDLFEFMQRHNLAYAYRVRFSEHPCCSRYLTKFIRMYTRDENMEISSPELQWMKKYSWSDLEEVIDQSDSSAVPMQQYYANMEIVHVESFRDDPAVLRWEQAVWNDTRYHVNGLFVQRWGDSLLRFYTIHLFPQLAKRIHYLCDINYFHQRHFPPACNFTQHYKNSWPIGPTLEWDGLSAMMP